MMDLGLVNDKELVDLAVAAMKVAEDAKSALEKYKAEIQNRGLSVLKDRNNQYCRMYGTDGSYVTETTKTTYTLDRKLQKALKAIVTNDYTFEYTLEDYLKEMSVPVSEGQREVLARRLKGDYKEDKKTLLSVLGYLGKGTTEEAAEAAAPNMDMDLYYISKIKNAELIQAILPDEGIDWSMDEIKRSLIVTSKLKLEIAYEREDK